MLYFKQLLKYFIVVFSLSSKIQRKVLKYFKRINQLKIQLHINIVQGHTITYDTKCRTYLTKIAILIQIVLFCQQFQMVVVLNLSPTFISQ